MEWRITLGITGDELVTVIHETVAGILDESAVAQEWDSAEHLGEAAGLSPREGSVLGLVVSGLSNQQIADRLYLSINSVKTYIRSAYRKLGVSSRRAGRRLGRPARLPGRRGALTRLVRVRGVGETFGVVGAGIVGLAVARELARRRPDSTVVVWEKEPRVGAHQTGHSSGVVHAGIYYRPGSLKAELCTRGRRLLEDYCAEHGLPFDACGKLVVAVDAGRGRSPGRARADGPAERRARPAPRRAGRDPRARAACGRARRPALAGHRDHRLRRRRRDDGGATSRAGGADVRLSAAVTRSGGCPAASSSCPGARRTASTGSSSAPACRPTASRAGSTARPTRGSCRSAAST